MLGTILSFVAGLASLACFIMVLVKMFKTQESPVMGIIGIVTCGIWAFIWGWMNAGKLGIKNIMLIWTVAIVVGAIGNGIAMASAARALQDQGMNPSIQAQ